MLVELDLQDYLGHLGFNSLLVARFGILNCCQVIARCQDYMKYHLYIIDQQEKRVQYRCKLSPCMSVPADCTKIDQLMRGPCGAHRSGI